MDMRKCMRICEADAITGHSHSILVAFKNDLNPSDSSTSSSHEHLPICYMKADTTEEIRWWQNLLEKCCRRGSMYINAMAHPSVFYSNQDQQEPVSLEACGPTIIQVNDLLSRPSSVNSSRSSNNEIVAMTSSRSSLNDVYHGTPRAIKYRDKITREEPLQPKSLNDGVDCQPEEDLLPELVPPPPPLPESQCPPLIKLKSSPTRPFSIDTSNAHTLRKGWLLLRGKGASDWTKHWVVLAGLSLKLYKDVWAEDSTEPLLSIDLTECENVYPSASARNYGIEIKCRRTRYVLSAMTPGIRDSWIAALQQNLHNPSPTDVETCTIDSRKKHIAYVAPESHHSNSMMDDDSCTEDELNLLERRPRTHQTSLSERSLESSDAEVDEFDNHPRPQKREHSLSPAFRRSPISRIKDKSSSRQQPCSSLRRHGSNSSLSSAPVQSFRTQRRNLPRAVKQDEGAFSQEMRLRSLESQVENLRDQLHDTTFRLGETTHENERLRCLFLSDDTHGLSQLRRSLTVAEDDVIRKRDEMETLCKQLATPTKEITSSTDFRCETVADKYANLLKIQVGALSRIVHAKNSVSGYNELRHNVDQLIRRVAGMDEDRSLGVKLTVMNDIVKQVMDVYLQVNNLLTASQREVADEETITEQPFTDDIANEVIDLENEIDELQAAHNEEMASVVTKYENQISSIRERLEHEEHRRKKAIEELKMLNSLNDHSVAAIKKTHEELLDSQRRQFQEQINAIRAEHTIELQEEKNATRTALDAVQRAHDAELRSINEKLKSSMSSASTQMGSTLSATDAQSSRQSKILEQMSAELTQLSALYSAKCLENSQLDEKMSLLLADKENQTSQNDVEAQNRRLNRELRQKDALIDELRQKLAAFERKSTDSAADDLSLKHESQGDGVQLLSTIPVLVKANQQQQNCLVEGKHQAASPSAVQPSVQGVKFRKNRQQTPKMASRRMDVRFHSSPVMTVTELAMDHLDGELRRSVILPVSERRKFFETIAEYRQPF